LQCCRLSMQGQPQEEINVCSSMHVVAPDSCHSSPCHSVGLTWLEHIVLCSNLALSCAVLDAYASQQVLMCLLWTACMYCLRCGCNGNELGWPGWLVVCHDMPVSRLSNLIGRPQPDCSQCFAKYKAAQKTVRQIHHGCKPEQAAWQHCFPACVLLLLTVHLQQLGCTRRLPCSGEKLSD
jgi:hypothetical protein